MRLIILFIFIPFCSFSQNIPFPVKIKYVDLNDTLDKRVQGAVQLSIPDYCDTAIYLVKGELKYKTYGVYMPLDWDPRFEGDMDDTMTIYNGWYHEKFLIEYWEYDGLYHVYQYLNVPDYDYVITYSMLPNGLLHGDLWYSDTLGTRYHAKYKNGKPDLKKLQKFDPANAKKLSEQKLVGLWGRNDDFVNPRLEIFEDGTYRHVATVGCSYRDTLNGKWKIQANKLILDPDGYDLSNLYHFSEDLEDGVGEFYLFGKYLCRSHKGFVDPYASKYGLKKMK